MIVPTSARALLLLAVLVLARHFGVHVHSLPMDNPQPELESIVSGRLYELADAVDTLEGAGEQQRLASATSSSETPSPGPVRAANAAVDPYLEDPDINPLRFLAPAGQNEWGVPVFAHPTLFHLVPPRYRNRMGLWKASSADRQLVLDKYRRDFVRFNGFDADIFWADDPDRLFVQPSLRSTGRLQRPPHARIISDMRNRVLSQRSGRFEEASYVINDYIIYFRTQRPQESPGDRRQSYIVALPLVEVNQAERGTLIEHPAIEVGMLDTPIVGPRIGQYRGTA